MNVVRKKFYSSFALSGYVRDNHISESAVVDVEIHGNELTLIFAKIKEADNGND